jgi:predicted nucleic acid-binding protein
VALILDTGPLYASLDRSDADHAACRALIEVADEPLLIPSPVLVEVDYWIHARLHAGVLFQLSYACPDRNQQYHKQDDRDSPVVDDPAQEALNESHTTGDDPDTLRPDSELTGTIYGYVVTAPRIERDPRGRFGNRQGRLVSPWVEYRLASTPPWT